MNKYRLMNRFLSSCTKDPLLRLSENDKIATLVLIRHGESIWNADPTFSGWCDPALTEKGRIEASETGKLLKSRGFTYFDRAYTSTLQRAFQTCDSVLNEASSGSFANNTKIEKAWQLNERHYGALQGLKKGCPELLEKYGAKQLESWRRGFHSSPPPMTKDHEYYLPPPAPLTESLSDCQDRVKKYWYDIILPSLVPKSKVLIAAHANTLRALVSYIDKVDLDKIPNIHIPNSIPCVYHIDKNGEVVSQVLDSAAGATRGHYMFSPENAARLKSKIGGTSHSYIRAIFNSWDVNNDNVLSKQEVMDGLKAVRGTEDPTFAVMAAKIFEEVDVDGSETLDLEEFDELAVKAFQKFLPDMVE